MRRSPESAPDSWSRRLPPGDSDVHAGSTACLGFAELQPAPRYTKQPETGILSICTSFCTHLTVIEFPKIRDPHSRPPQEKVKYFNPPLSDYLLIEFPLLSRGLIQ